MLAGGEDFGRLVAADGAPPQNVAVLLVRCVDLLHVFVCMSGRRDLLRPGIPADGAAFRADAVFGAGRLAFFGHLISVRLAGQGLERDVAADLAAPGDPAVRSVTGRELLDDCVAVPGRGEDFLDLVRLDGIVPVGEIVGDLAELVDVAVLRAGGLPGFQRPPPVVFRRCRERGRPGFRAADRAVLGCRTREDAVRGEIRRHVAVDVLVIGVKVDDRLCLRCRDRPEGAVVVEHREVVRVREVSVLDDDRREAELRRPGVDGVIIALLPELSCTGHVPLVFFAPIIDAGRVPGVLPRLHISAFDRYGGGDVVEDLPGELSRAEPVDDGDICRRSVHVVVVDGIAVHREEEIGVSVPRDENALQIGQVDVRVPREDHREIPVRLQRRGEILRELQIVFLFRMRADRCSAVDPAVSRVDHHDDLSVSRQIRACGCGEKGKRKQYNKEESG